MYKTDLVVDAIKSSWSPQTCYSASEWSDDNPARGQCVVSALVLQDYCGGSLRKFQTTYKGLEESHYANVLPDGTEVDVTRSQYPADLELVEVDIDLKGYDSIRDKLFAKANTRARYELLKRDVEVKLAAHIAE